MDDKIIDAAMARALHVDACRDHALVAWVVLWDVPGYPDQPIARLATKRLSPYVLVADTLAGVQEQLPPGLVRIGAAGGGSARGGGDLVCVIAPLGRANSGSCD